MYKKLKTTFKKVTIAKFIQKKASPRAVQGEARGSGRKSLLDLPLRLVFKD